jgi:hypothetical protein
MLNLIKKSLDQIETKESYFFELKNGLKGK